MKGIICLIIGALVLGLGIKAWAQDFKAGREAYTSMSEFAQNENSGKSGRWGIYVTSGGHEQYDVTENRQLPQEAVPESIAVETQLYEEAVKDGKNVVDAGTHEIHFTFWKKFPKLFVFAKTKEKAK